METTITTIELSKRLDDILDRVREQRERFRIERDGEVIAELVPRTDVPSGDLRELVARLALLPPIDEDYESDIEKARAVLLPAKAPEWSD